MAMAVTKMAMILVATAVMIGTGIHLPGRELGTALGFTSAASTQWVGVPASSWSHLETDCQSRDRQADSAGIKTPGCTAANINWCRRRTVRNYTVRTARPELLVLFKPHCAPGRPDQSDLVADFRASDHRAEQYRGGWRGVVTI